jgi:hypothetical protein
VLSLDQVKARHIRARELRGLEIDQQRQAREAAEGKFTLFLALEEHHPAEFRAWIEQQESRGVIVKESFEFRGSGLRAGRYAVVNQQGWSMPDSHPRFQVEVTYAWTGPVGDENGVDLKAELDKRAGEATRSGHVWWITKWDEGNMPEEFDADADAEEHAAIVADQPLRPQPEIDWSMV